MDRSKMTLIGVEPRYLLSLAIGFVEETPRGLHTLRWYFSALRRSLPLNS